MSHRPLIRTVLLLGLTLFSFPEITAAQADATAAQADATAAEPPPRPSMAPT